MSWDLKSFHGSNGVVSQIYIKGKWGSDKHYRTLQSLQSNRPRFCILWKRDFLQRCKKKTWTKLVLSSYSMSTFGIRMAAGVCEIWFHHLTNISARQSRLCTNVVRGRFNPIFQFLPLPLFSLLPSCSSEQIYKGQCLNLPSCNWTTLQNPFTHSVVLDGVYVNRRYLTFPICRVQLWWFLLLYRDNPLIIMMPFIWWKSMWS